MTVRTFDSDTAKIFIEYASRDDWSGASLFLSSLLGHSEVSGVEYSTLAEFYSIANEKDYAIDALRFATSIYPKNETLLRQLHLLYENIGNWRMARSLSKKLADLRPEDPSYLFSLGKALVYMGNIDEAKGYLAQGLTKTHGATMEDIYNKVEKSLGFDLSQDLSTEYVFNGGASNLGGFVHKIGKKKFYTKISRVTDRSIHERDFYSNVLGLQPLIKDLVPEYVSSLEIDGVLYLTIEMIDIAPVSKGSVKQVIEVSNSMADVPYSELLANIGQKLPAPLVGRPTSSNGLFLHIDKKYANEIILNSLSEIAKRLNYTISINKNIDKLKKMVMGNRIYNYAVPHIQYGLIHGDFNIDNVVLDKKRNKVRVIDWETYIYGPRFLGIARFFASSRFSYSSIRDEYVYSMIESGKSSKVEQAFFLYAYIVFLILDDKGRSMAEIDKLTTEAMSDMESLVNDFVNANKGLALGFLSEKERMTDAEKEDAINELASQRRQYESVISSKSWKITKPLRSIMGLLR